MSGVPDSNSNIPKGNIKFDALKNVRQFEWLTGFYGVSIHLARPLEQLINAEHAAKKKYVPCGKPDTWPIERSRWTVLPNGYSKNHPKFSAPLLLEETDIPLDAVAYVPSGKLLKEGSDNRYMLISMQFYKKKPSLLSKLI